ncbi:MAG TPA: zinc ABC transporter ATP-binding protein ZnuC [Gammaproteobacteria bacterium]|jgi:zinc transport system ATP-binding protein|nr:zinc ABC transporter ATP-binding protein ZnuC [Acidiferrobacteraceae bacterium]MDP6398527.1 ATP-binding cassette domain-containing protein [Arenicellales bacterium]MDP6791108.1 ATP-binding cassette domain-containing protein [Arenicellales bacterium]MDP6918892.1 ATP-binding cassette domain-containing protein [Arenicellales bacterium]HCX87043.1 zinc ABC transporter ATP-binding protein ZnuC [Gammaproteobacteria bacterium]|tara:strand:- start:13931 stop:14671 length:741 start_codon:yes stop_codon:yes gene_type:complete
MSLIRTQGVGVCVGARRILRDVDLSVRRREIVTVVGPNGSGKTTLLKVLIGAQAPSEGVVVREAGIKIGYVPQRLAIDQAMPLTVARWLGLSGTTAKESHLQIAEQVGISVLLKQQMTSLSGGEFQRALLAQALLVRPDLLVLDEPTQGLDQPAVASFYRLIEDVRTDLDCAVLMVSHDLHVVMRSSDHVICLNGHVCCQGTPTLVSAAPEYQALFGFGAEGALALYRHEHDHRHDHSRGGDSDTG